MPEIMTGLVCLAVLFLLIYSGFPVAIALMLCAYGGVWVIKGSELLAAKLLALTAYDTIAHYHFGVIPLFILMGFIVSETGIARDAFEVANQLLRKLTGGLSIATIGANAVFASITGISIASASVFTRIAVPELIRHGYSAKFATGLVAGSSVLGMLIPPSLLLILYGIVTEQSVGDLFLAGFLPGFLLAGIFIVGVSVMARFAPDYVGTHLILVSAKLLSKTEMCKKILPVVLIVLIILGGIYLGIFTPVEASAAGVLAVIVVALIRRQLSWNRLRYCFQETMHVTANICFLIITAQMFSKMMTFAGIPVALTHGLLDSNFPVWLLIFAYIGLIILFGAILDSASTMLIVVPLFLPIFVELQFDLIWLGIITVIAVEIGLLTPPLGIAVYVVHSTYDSDQVSLGDVFLGALPFIAMMLVTLLLLILFPQITTVLL